MRELETRPSAYFGYIRCIYLSDMFILSLGLFRFIRMYMYFYVHYFVEMLSMILGYLYSDVFYILILGLY